MIILLELSNPGVLRYSSCDPRTIADEVKHFLVEGEKIGFTYKTTRDAIFFTTKRIIFMDKQGVTGSKTDFTSVPWDRIQAFSLENAGHVDYTAEFEFYLSTIGKVKIELKDSKDFDPLHAFISAHVL